MNAAVQDVSKAVKKEASPVETVKMSDGRTVDFVGKRKLIKESLIEGQEVKVRLDFRNGETRLVSVNPQLLYKAAAHGYEQKLGDETAAITDVDDMTIAVDELIDRLNQGEWNTRREGNGFAGTSVLLRALVEASGKSIEAIKGFLSTKSQQDKMALRNSPKIKPIVDRIEAEKAAKNDKVDTEALLGELNSI